MKVNIEMDMTPEEARVFMGLPDIAPLQKNMLDALQNRMQAALGGGDPEAMMEAWATLFDPAMGGGAEAFRQFHKRLWDGAKRAGSSKTP